MHRIRPSLLGLGVLASVLLQGVAASLAQVAPPRDPYTLEVAALTVRTVNVPRGSVDVLVTARDDSAVGWIDLDCAGDRRRIAGEDRAFVTALVRCTPVEGTAHEVRATVFSPDGVRSGAPVVAPILFLDHETDATPHRRFPRHRLRDSSYPARVGSFDNYAQQVVPVVSLDGRPWWLRWADSEARKPFDFAAKCPPGVDHVAPDGLALRCWLNLHPHVRKQIVWHEYLSPVPRVDSPEAQPRGIVDKLMPYDTWTEDMKIWLDVSVYWAYRYLESGLETFSWQFLPAVPPNVLDLEDCESTSLTIIAHDDAWKLYLGTIAHSLALELGKFVPWSIAGYTDPDLRLLFHSDTFIWAGRSHIEGDVLLGYRPRYTIPAPPTTTFEFLVNRDLVRATAFSTVGRFMEFARYGNHFYHEFALPGVCGTGAPWLALASEIVHGYRGAVPVARLLEGTNPVTPPGPPDVHAGWVNGCVGGANLFQHVFRAVNIPVEGEAEAELGNAQHRAPFFFTLGYTMSHLDDIFNWSNASIPPFPGSWLLLPMETYEDWFLGAGKLGNSGWANVSRQAMIEVPLKALSNELVQRFCLDKASGASHSDGTLAAYFRVEGTNLVYYDVAQLEALDLWSKLEAKAAVLGFC